MRIKLIININIEVIRKFFNLIIFFKYIVITFWLISLDKINLRFRATIDYST
jgi:hypothetical protein